MLPEINTFYDRLVYAKQRSCAKVKWSSIAKEVGIDKSNFTRYKSYEYFPSAVTLLRIARVLEIDAFWLAGNDVSLADCELPLLAELYDTLSERGREALIHYAETLVKEEYKKLFEMLS